jgi:hypothetical protein
MRKNRVLICLAVLLAAIGAPAGFSQSVNEQVKSEPVTSSAHATVYVYRYKQFAGYAVEPSVYCNEVQLARMDNGRYFKVMLSPGEYVFRSNDKQSGIELEVKSGEEYYLRVEIVQGLLKQRGRLVLMAKEQGAYEIKKLKPLGLNKVKDRARVVVDEAPPKGQ